MTLMQNLKGSQKIFLTVLLTEIRAKLPLDSQIADFLINYISLKMHDHTNSG